MNAFRIRQFLGSAAAILLLAAVVAEPVQAQRGTVAGQVTDKSNQPVSGASVIIIGTSLQGRTTREGRQSWHAGWPFWIGTGWLGARWRIVGVYVRLGDRAVFISWMPRRRSVGGRP